jgi:acetyltransferase-like isoleucine patch superfamily enzyme
MIRIPAQLYHFASKAWRRMLMYLYRPMFAAHGRNFRFDPFGAYTFATISVGDDVNLGVEPILMAAKSTITIGNKVMFGPQVMLIGGVHNTSVVGQFMFDVTEKCPDDDRGVVIEDDVWVGARAMILQGVVVGRGSIVGAGAVVTKSVPPYAVVAGVPARVVKFRWDVDTILRHEEALYPPERRLAREALLRIQELGERHP